MNQQYQTTNGCSKTPSFLCILTLLVYLGIIALHLTYIFTPIIKGIITNNPILYVLLGLHFVLLAVIVYDYLWIMVHDPVDSIILDPQLADNISDTKKQQCRVCNKYRLVGSHHCSQCNRCTEDFDHHCRYLNNCIGRKNYEKFVRLLSMNVLFHINIIGQGLWVFLTAVSNQEVKYAIPRSYWVIVGIMGLCFILLIVIAVLLLFHCYISCCLRETTLGYLYGGAIENHRNVSNINKNFKLRSSIQTQRYLSNHY